MSEQTGHIIKDKFNVAILGLAVGNAMDVHLEFKNPGSFQPVKDMIDGGSINLQPSMRTDDTS